MTPQTLHAVDPDRLAYGAWSHDLDRQIGEGDMSASYSADRIGMGKPVRKPFRHEGALYVCIGKQGDEAKCYKLVHPSRFPDDTFTYGERVTKHDGADFARFGFYHGMRIQSGGQELVMCGPETTFIKGEKVQLSLF